MEAIGGYFELELRKGEHYHKEAIKLNTARNCFEYILRARKYTKVYIPYYTCEVMLEPLHKCNVAYEFYHINDLLEPTGEYKLNNKEAFLYTNYFGLKQCAVERLAKYYGKQLIVDNAQAFFAPRIEGIDTFYSPRKFFGVSDGAYLYTDCLLEDDFEQDYSYERMSHLLKRIDCTAEEGYNDFRHNDSLLCNMPIKKMSKLSEAILCSIDYEMVKCKRIENYRLLDDRLSQVNKIKLHLDESVPMVYPFYICNDGFRESLFKKKIYIAKYWENVCELCQNSDIEFRLATNVIPLPIDQRIEMNNCLANKIIDNLV